MGVVVERHRRVERDRTRRSRPAGRRESRTRSRRASSRARCRSSGRARPPGARSGPRAPRPQARRLRVITQPSSSATAGSDTSRLRGVKIGCPTSDSIHISPTGTTSQDSASTAPHRASGRARSAPRRTSSSATVGDRQRAWPPTVGRKFGSKPAEVSARITCLLELEVRPRDPEQLTRPAAEREHRERDPAHRARRHRAERPGATPRRRHASASSCAGSAKIAT